MISVIISFKNSNATAVNCLRTTLRTFQQLGTTAVEFILIDDQSDPEQNIPQLMAEFRTQVPSGVRAVEFLFKEHQHYTRALAYGFSAAKGKQLLFVSHDMLLTPAYVRGVLAVAAADETIGLVRGTSPYVDCFPQHKVVPPFTLRSYDDVDDFADYVSAYWGLQWVEDRLLTGDSMLIKREVIDKIGVFDPRYFGYFGDIDFGLRLQRAGFKMVCAKGAWLWHEGAAAYKDKAQQTQQQYATIHAARMQVVNNAYLAFRDKWDSSLPPAYPGTDAIPLERLRHLPPLPGGEYQPPITPDVSICEIR